jgi:hypothetical protein
MTDMRAFSDSADGFSVSVPSAWQQVSLTDPAAIDAVKQVLARNPKLAPLVGNPDDLASGGTKYLAVDPSGGFVNVVNVAVTSDPGAPSNPSDSDLESGYPDLKSGMEKAGGTVTAHRLITINGRRALQVKVDLPIQAAGATIVGHGTVDAFLATDTDYVLTLVADPAVVHAIEATFKINR